MGELLSQEAQWRIVSDAANAAQQIVAAFLVIEGAQTRPSVLYRPRLSVDGSQWCALYGDNLQDGVAGFGDSPAQAMHEFDRAWIATLPRQGG